MSPMAGRIVLVVSGLGFPLTQVAIRRFDRAGAVAAQSVAVGLFVRDAALIASGAPRRLRRGPARMLWLEAAIAAVAAALCLPLVFDESARRRAAAARPATGGEAARRVAMGALFGLHTMRFRIYLTPDRGRRTETAE